MARSGTKTILDGQAIDRAIGRMAEEIVERSDVSTLALIGVRTRGVPLAQRLAARIKAVDGREVSVGVLDITLYRDDFTTVGSQAVLRKTEIDFPITDVDVVLVDDVLFTGRTVRAALDGLVDFGRPRRIQLAVLVDRGHRELPVRADFVGKTIATTLDEFVQVNLKEFDQEDGVVVGDLAPGRTTTRAK